jgi:hypothetical protein
LTPSSLLPRCLWLMGHDAAGAGVQRWWHGLIGEDGTRVAVGEEGVQVGMDEHVLAHAADLIAHDLTATLGWEAGRAGTEARAVLENRAGLLRSGLAWEGLDRTRQQEILDDVVVAAVEDLQQRLHDTFVDTSWPSCLRHPHHPMWLTGGQGGGVVWCCPRDHAEMALLGRLPARATRAAGIPEGTGQAAWEQLD